MAIGRCYTSHLSRRLDRRSGATLGLDGHLQKGILCHAWTNRRYFDNTARTILVADVVGYSRLVVADEERSVLEAVNCV